MKTLGELIRTARTGQSISTTDLAARVGIAQSTLSRIENDRFVEAPEPRVLRAFSEILGVPEPEMLLALGYRISEDAPIYDADAAQIARVIAKLTPAERRFLLELMESASGGLMRAREERATG
jgi:transcriptional regulator with XRE-family HTH domain